jgi:hypothetical protein
MVFFRKGLLWCIPLAARSFTLLESLELVCASTGPPTLVVLCSTTSFSAAVTSFFAVVSLVRADGFIMKPSLRLPSSASPPFLMDFVVLLMIFVYFSTNWPYLFCWGKLASSPALLPQPFLDRISV